MVITTCFEQNYELPDDPDYSIVASHVEIPLDTVVPVVPGQISWETFHQLRLIPAGSR